MFPMLLESTRAQSISSPEQVQHQNAKNSQHRDQQQLYFTSVNSNVTENYSASVFMFPMHYIQQTHKQSYITQLAALTEEDEKRADGHVGGMRCQRTSPSSHDCPGLIITHPFSLSCKRARLNCLICMNCASEVKRSQCF